ncbi:MAG: Re/Si-specific NAD(P)(+) transhydrogenase subunit alpha [Flavobacteriaceae bacterium]|nr:Re/Si-specific NAD(P)(+) transhydrogenase subunit alpha [Flavobacteriaceae bacterium]
MKIGILKETQKGEKRVSITPKIAEQLIGKGFEVFVEEDAGHNSQYKNYYYTEVGAVVSKKKDIFKNADILVKINPFDNEELEKLQKGQVVIAQLFHKSHPEDMKIISKQGATALSLDAMPRITRAQDMDVLSSQNNLAGYKAVIKGAYEMTKIFPLMMTAAGTITPSRVLIFGVGVAGLQAIATAKRLGAIVEATDIRLETKEQTESLGAKFITVDNTGEEEAEGGYAKAASDDYKRRQQEAVNASLFKADLVITTAMVPGRRSPVLITEEQVKQMKNGAVIIDLAAAQGGNCELSKLNKRVVKHGVKIFGATIAPESVSTNASDLFAKNLYNYLVHLTDENGFKWDLEDQITDGTLIVFNGEIRKNGKTE